MSERVFWLEGEDDGAGGVFIRTELGPFFAKMLSQGMRPVGIVIDGDERNTQVLYKQFATLLPPEDSTDGK